MKLLWVKTDFLHPTTRGGQIRTLETVRRLHRNHELHYVAFAQPGETEGLRRAGEYSARAFPVMQRLPSKRSLAFAGQLAAGLVSPLPVAVSRYRSAAMRRQIETLCASEMYDAVVCDFLAPTPNLPDLSRCILFQHNVEAIIWERHAETAQGLLKRRYFKMQAERMRTYEGAVCRAVRRVIAVSREDARIMRDLYGVESIAPVPTGVDVEYFARPSSGQPLSVGDQRVILPGGAASRHQPQPAADGRGSGPAAYKSDLVFVGSMDWMPNVDSMRWFAREIYPRILAERPQTTLAIAGRSPAPEIVALARSDSRITVTGTVPDVRPWLWGSSLSIVPLRVGGGTRLKIFEAMAAELPVISTTVGAEGLDVIDGEHIVIADGPERFAAGCLELLGKSARREELARAARELVVERYSWDSVAADFERLLT